MVYCSKCGTLNPDDANVCSKCGAALQAAGQEAGPYWRQRRYGGDYYRYHRGGAGMGALIFGIIIILVGLSVLFSEVYGINFPWWPIILVLIGFWVLFVGVRRSRRCSSQQA